MGARARWAWVVAWMTAAASFVACDPPRSACVPGESRACVCETAASGAQVCDGDGAGFGTCRCAPSPTVDGGPAEIRCGDGLCNGGEDSASCPSDCPSVCGDTTCVSGEAPATCPMDCPAACGDGACTHAEDASCESDCRARCGDGLCTHSESESSCPADCDPICGDTVCSATEGCGSCALDCGACLPSTIEFFVTGAVVRPWDSGNLRWDDNTAVDAVLQSDIITALASGDPVSAIVAEIGTLIASAGLAVTAAPDIYGVAGIEIDGTAYPDLNVNLVPNEEDAYQVEFSARGWTLGDADLASVRLWVNLRDEDVAFDDPIGTVVLTEEDLREAWNEAPNAFHWVQVSDQMTPILFIQIRVRTP